MDLIQELGELAFASRLKRLSERLMRDVAAVYAAHDVDFEPRWFPVVYLLRTRSPMAITEIAITLGVTHPAVNQTAAAMARHGLLVSKRDRHDERRRLLALSARGRALGDRLQPVWAQIGAATRDLLEAEAPGMLGDLARIERSLDERSVGQRIGADRRRRPAPQVEIADYAPCWRADFARLNREWLEEFFTLEPQDAAVLADPEKTILVPGGTILFALVEGRPVGTVALVRHDADTVELAKMAVTATLRGGGIGRRLAQAAIERARDSGARQLILQTSARLVAATRLYRELGFRRCRRTTPMPHSYRRPTFVMQLDLRGAAFKPGSRRRS
jgi:GNAT superfamily N-acetyltransferase/DNA-binding MarR family transcriptional regulator